MNRQQVLDLVGGLPGKAIAAVWEASAPISALELRPGVYLGRNGGMPAPLKWMVRNVVGRDWFAKLVLDGYGVNVRCFQDGSHRFRPSARVPDGVEVDMPFRPTDLGLDYGLHVLGADVPLALQFRDHLRRIEFRLLPELVPEEHLARVGVRRGDPCEEADLVLGYMAPLGIERLMSTPFGMVWRRDPEPAEVASAEEYIGRGRLLDSGCGRRAARRA
ncbi:MAG: hypothetical protein QME96_01850 [Myxococcota bacterium]|nr:hypothetical protein [Myxococcota bacterium]